MEPSKNQLTERIIGAAIAVCRELGPGLLESACQRALAHMLTLRKVVFREQLSCPLSYKDLTIDNAYRLDLLVGRSVVVEIKTVGQLLGVHNVQLLICLRLPACPIELLLNLLATRLTQGILRLSL